MFWNSMTLALVVIYRTDMTAQRYVEEQAVPFASFVGSLFKLMHDNAQQLRGQNKHNSLASQ